MKANTIALQIMLIILPLLVASAETRVYHTRKVNPKPPVIDGCLDDPAWDRVSWQGDFIQREPHENQPPSQETAFKILYDDNNLYVAVRAFDSCPDSIECRLTRRDNIDGDLVAVQIDSYKDLQTAFSFMVSAGGVKIDGIFTNNGQNEDYSWDPVWYVKTTVDEGGWNAEMQIPLSQLRFAARDAHVWGLQVARFLYRKEELSLWQFIPKNASGWVHHFGELNGIMGVQPSRRIELLPYMVGQLETMEKEPWNPFAPGHLQKGSMGLDGKIGVTSDLTLDFTINPDFGQVEADPSVVNLTAFETFYQEKRPFFIEGANILNYRLMMGDGDFSYDNLFYSRRIGRAPRYRPDMEDGEYLSMPMNTSILGAMKLTGKTRGGWSVGIMDAVTSSETAQLDYHGSRREQIVEPSANYLLGRLQKDLRDGATKIGGILTHTYRDIRYDELLFMNRDALTGGIDFRHEWKDRNYFLSFNSVFSHIRGDESAMLRAQRSSARYFQRPDADHVYLDSSLTSLTGFGGSLTMGKNSGHLQFTVGSTWRSPGLELNDMGYLRQADVIMQFAWIGYREWNPFYIFRSMNININQWSGWNFGSENTFNGGNININFQFRNYWGAGAGIGINGRSLSPSALRGGPSLLLEPRWNNWVHFYSDSRRTFTFRLGGSNTWSLDGFSRSHSVQPSITWKPNSTLSLSANPFFSVNKQDLQYIKTLKDPDRYLFGRIDQKTLGLTLRLNCFITPELSVQYYGQPFVSAGHYAKLRKIVNPRADVYHDRYHVYTQDEITYDTQTGSYLIDDNGDGAVDFSVNNPDFNFREFRSNLVIRLEYSPGSTLFLVWSQGRSGVIGDGSFLWYQDMRDLFEIPPYNVFLIKFNRWFSL
ncbi:MAG TPA: hypothetical protein ENN03_00240 [bacterium]|nr:hypothetical protein [bacterium]